MTLLPYLLTSAYCVWAYALSASTKSAALDTRGFLNGKECYRWSCQVQACLPTITSKAPDVKYASNVAFCLFSHEIRDDCGSVVSGIGPPLDKSYITCPSNTTLRQFEYKIWRSYYDHMEDAQYSLGWETDVFPFRAWGLNCTREENVSCTGNKSFDYCDPGRDKIGCRVNSTFIDGCDQHDGR